MDDAAIYLPHSLAVRLPNMNARLHPTRRSLGPASIAFNPQSAIRNPQYSAPRSAGAASIAFNPQSAIRNPQYPTPRSLGPASIAFNPQSAIRNPQYSAPRSLGPASIAFNPQSAIRNPQYSGSVLIVVLVVCLGLVSLTLVLGHSMLLAFRGSDNELAGRQADMAIEGAAQYAETILSNVDQPGEMPDPDNYQAQAVPLGDATFWFIGEPDQTATSNFPTFGLVDEASKLNLNTATLAMLENLPGMTQDLAQAIVAWRTSSSASPSPGAAAPASSTSEVKNARFESVEELAQVNGGTDLLTLYGSDTNLNHVLDPNESAGGATSFTPGLLEYCTVFSRQPNTLSNGTKRINVTQFSGSLARLLTSALGSTRGGQVTVTLRRAGPVHSVLEFYNKSGMNPTEFAEVSGSLTMTRGAYSTGLINVNTASETVLECVPGITASTAAQIVSTREAQTQPITNLSWVAPILGKAASAQAGPYLTAETYQIGADIAAVGRHGRGYRRTLFVIDNSTGAPQIVYRRNLAGLGWALGSQERQALASAEASP